MLDDIEQLDPNSNVTILMFHQNVAAPIKFKASDFNHKDIENKCDEMIKQSTWTGICNAWDQGVKLIDPHRNNYLYLFTDGLENVNHNGTEAVCQRIRNWCKTAPNNYAFFVALPSSELLNSPAVRKLKAATDDCDRTFYISSKFGPFGAFDKTNFNLNSHSIKNIKTDFSDYGNFKAAVSCNDPYYDVKLKDGMIKDGKAEFLVKQKKAPSTNHQIHIKVNSNPKDLHISNPDIFINIDTRNFRNLDLAQPSGINNGQYNAGNAETYDSFLFASGKDADVVNVDLEAIFNAEAKKRGCTMLMSIINPKSGYSYRYNGKPVNEQFTIDSKDSQSILEITVPHNSSKGESIIGLNGHSNSLETINAENTKNYVSSIRVNHDIVWNPLKVFLFWTAIVIGIALIVWFLFLRPICFPRIRLSRIQMTSDNGYYASKKINGAKKIVVGPSKGHQSFLNRLFTRRIVYIASPIWSSFWEMTPKGYKKLLRANLHGNYMVTPITTEFENLGTYKLTDRQNNNVITVKIL